MSSLSLEDPWLAAAHGAVSLIDVDVMMRGGRGGGGASGSPPVRQLPAPGTQLQCVDIADQWVAAGTKTGIVQAFDYTCANEARARSAASQQARPLFLAV